MSHSVAHPKSNLSSHIISQLASKSDLIRPLAVAARTSDIGSRLAAC